MPHPPFSKKPFRSEPCKTAAECVGILFPRDLGDEAASPSPPPYLLTSRPH